MKTELIRKVIPDFYIYKGEKRESYRLIFEYYDENEDLKNEKLRFKNEKEANKKLKEFEKRETQNKGRFVSDKNRLRFADFAESYKKRMLKRLSPTSHDGEIIRVNAAIKFFGNRTIASIRRKQIDEYKEFLGQEARTTATINRYLQRLRNLLNEACIYDDSLAPVNFKGDLIKSGLEKKRTRTIGFDEFDRVMTACTGRQRYLRLYYLCLWETGARESEIQGNRENPHYLPGVKRADIDLQNQTIRLWNSKLHPGKPPEQRIAYLSEFLINELYSESVNTLPPDALVFPVGDFKKSWSIIKERAKLDETERENDKNSGVFWERDLRHCFVNNADDAGVQKSVIAHQINHNADADLLGNVYIHQRPEFLRRKFERFEAHSKAERLKLAGQNVATETGFEYEIERFERV